MSWSWANIDWDKTAEPLAVWVGAIGTVVAIWWSGRLARMQAEREEMARLDADKAARADRHAAIMNCQLAFESMANALRTLHMVDGSVGHLPSDAIRRISAAEWAVTYY